MRACPPVPPGSDAHLTLPNFAHRLANHVASARLLLMTLADFVYRGLDRGLVILTCGTSHGPAQIYLRPSDQLVFRLRGVEVRGTLVEWRLVMAARDAWGMVFHPRPHLVLHRGGNRARARKSRAKLELIS